MEQQQISDRFRENLSLKFLQLKNLKNLGKYLNIAIVLSLLFILLLQESKERFGSHLANLDSMDKGIHPKLKGKRIKV
jgi:hypothetical protein